MVEKAEAGSRHLLATMTNEAFQPVRLYYSIPGRRAVEDRLGGLRCMKEARSESCWQWLFEAEAKRLPLQGRYEEIPEDKRPIILGRVRFQGKRLMILQTNSIDRAIEGARFLAPHLGPGVVLTRCRVVNRFFASEEGRPEQLMQALDRSVTVVDPREREASMRRDIESLGPMQDPEQMAGALMQVRLDRKDDVPLVEDFPLNPEEETPDFQNLATTLKFRFVRASEHWRGNTHLTLTAIIMRAVQGAQ